MKRQRFIKLLSICIALLVQVQNCDLNLGFMDFSYEAKPELPFEFEHLKLDASITESPNTVKGVATYSITAKAPDRSKLILKAGELEIDGVVVDGNEAEFTVEGDSLIIALPDTMGVREKAELSITWQSGSTYVIHRDRNGTRWSSLNPGSAHHWFPVYDHPRVAFTLDAGFTIPAERELIFNGRKTDDEVVSTEQRKVRWTSDEKLPATGLSFALGDFIKTDAMAGTKRIHLFAQRGLISPDSLNRLLNEAVMLKRTVENRLSFEYPYESLSVVVLEDSYWEEEQAGAGLIYLYPNLGSLSAQLQRGIYSQWFGQYQRMEEYGDGFPFRELMKTALHYSVSDKPALLRAHEEEDLHASAYIWNEVQLGFPVQESYFKETVTNSLSELVREEEGVVGLHYYSDHWYEKTGLNWEELESWKEPGERMLQDEEERPEYRVSAAYNETNSMLSLYFNNTAGNGETLSGLKLNVFTFEDTTSQVVSFTGAADTIAVELPMSVEYITFSPDVTSLEDLSFGEFPLFFLLNQLRSGDAKDRALAASLLSLHTDNPDLQLAIRDALESETDPLVQARLLETLGAFTRGDTGTEQTFLQELNNEHEEIQIAALSALSNYQNNDYVVSSVRNKVLRSEGKVYDAALSTFTRLSGTNDLISLAGRLLQVDTTAQKSVEILESAVAEDTTTQAMGILKSVVEGDYPPSARMKAAGLIMEHIHSIEAPAELLLRLAADEDPRVRYIVALNRNRLTDEAAAALASEMMEKETDLRVLKELY